MLAQPAKVSESRGTRTRALWPAYTTRERELLERKFLEGWGSLEFMHGFWKPVFDERDVAKWRELGEAWRLRREGKGGSRVGQFVKGYNLRPYFAHMYLNSQALGKPTDGWKWIFERTPEPTDPYPRAALVPDTIQSYNDVTEFLAQFPTVADTDENLGFFGLTTKWVEEHRAELFGFLLGFLVGDAGKSYPEYETREALR